MKYKFIRYDHHKTANKSINSPDFYTSPEGHKMCINVYANGVGEAEGTHVSVFPQSRVGNKTLMAPAIARSFLAHNLLANWLMTEYNIFRIMMLILKLIQYFNGDFSSKSPGQVIIVLSLLEVLLCGYSVASNCQYLKNDCLYFRISVDAKRSSCN